MHTTSGRWVYGFMLALTTAILWGLLPIAINEVVKDMTPITITWFRFFTAGIVLVTYLALKRRLPQFSILHKKGLALVLISILGLLGNYVLYVVGLHLLDPGTTQLVMQTAPLLLIIGSVIVFKEKFNIIQFLALIVLIIGFALFFNKRLFPLFTTLNQYTIGVLITLLAAFLWAFYGLAQKQLLTKWHSFQIMMVIYLASSILLFPFAMPSQIIQLSSTQFWLLIFCCINTLIAYGAFAEALAHWEAYKVSATLAIAPLITFSGVALCSYIWSDYFTAEPLNMLSYFGAIVVVTGSTLIALSPVLFRKIKTNKG